MEKKLLTRLIAAILAAFLLSSCAFAGARESDGHWIGMNWPLVGSGVKSSAFGERLHPIINIVRAHGGIDIAAPKGTTIVASLGGRVFATGTGEELGKYIIIEHSDSRQTVYGHLSEIKVKKGQFVAPREAIGKVGSTGLSTGPHLHFAVKKNGRFVNPEIWMVPTGYLKK